MPNKLKFGKQAVSATVLEFTLIVCTLVFGLVHTWAGRYSMNPDGISYLDLGDAFTKHDWAHAFSAWWSPGYPWILGIVVNLIGPSPRFEFPLVHIVNFLIFIATLAAFRFLLHEVIKFCNEGSVSEPRTFPLPRWSLLLLGYAIFLWTSLEVVSIYGVGPDLLVMLFVCLIGGMLLGLRRDPSLLRFLLFGLILGVGYWFKTILLPLGVVSLLCVYMWKPASRSRRFGVAVAALLLLLISAPLVLSLSKEKGRFTIGDTGKLNYARWVFPRMAWTNWQGEVPGGGKPLHPTRQILSYPAVFEFDGPVIGTYPPWTDPSYWLEGVQPQFRARPQLQVLEETTPSEVRVLLREQPDLVVGVIVLAFLAGGVWWVGLRSLWPLIAILVVGMTAYLPLVVNDRYLGGFVLLLFIALIAAVRLRPTDQRSAGYVAIAVFATMMVSTLDLTVRYATHHLVNPGAGPNSTVDQIAIAEGLAHQGARRGDKIAILADGSGTYWARLAKLRVIAQVGRGGETETFWQLSNETKDRVYRALYSAHAEIVVGQCPHNKVAGWTQIASTNACVHWLGESNRGDNP